MMAGAWGLEIDKGRIGLCRARLTSRGLEVTPGISVPLPCWRLKSHIPFPINESRIDYQPLPGQGSGTRLLYLLAREAVIAQYEALVASVGLEPTRIIPRGVALYRLPKTSGIGGKRPLPAARPSRPPFSFVE